MKKTNEFLIKVATTATLAALMATSTFAENRPADATAHSDYQLVQYGRGERRDQPRRSTSVDGRIRSIQRDRDGYRVELDRGDYVFWVPDLVVDATRGRMRTADLRVGASIRIEGWNDRDRVIRATRLEWLGGNGGWGDRDRESRIDPHSLRGIVTDVNFRRNTIVVREFGTGRVVAVEMMRGDNRRNRSYDLDRVHRGDSIMLSGEMVRGGGFRAWRIDEFRDRH